MYHVTREHVEPWFEQMIKADVSVLTIFQVGDREYDKTANACLSCVSHVMSTPLT